MEIYKELEVFVAVRHCKCDGYMFMDVGTISGDREFCKHQAREYDKKVPTLAAANPVVDIKKAKLILSEE